MELQDRKEEKEPHLTEIKRHERTMENNEITRLLQAVNWEHWEAMIRLRAK